MDVELGGRRWDVTHRALVVGVIEGPDDARRHAEEGADLLATADLVDTDLPVVPGDLDGPLVVPLPAPGTDRETALAQTALAITNGARIVLTRDVRGTRRVADVLAAILKRE